MKMHRYFVSGWVLLLFMQNCAYAETANANAENVDTVTVVDIETQAADLVIKAREAMLGGENAQAVFLLERVLRLPPNIHSREAQELAGIARERLNEIDKAKQEYELYLRLYPLGEDAERVRQRLAAINASPQETLPRTSKRTSIAQAENLFTGNLFQYYYRGNSKIELTPFSVTANPLEKETLSLLDQSALVSNIAFNARHRDANSEHRFVFRDTVTQDFVSSKNDKHRLMAAYYDFRQRQNSYNIRVGRQPASSSGVFARFDGVSAGLQLFPQWRLNAVAGKVNDNYFSVSPEIFGLNLDMGIFADHWSGNIYNVQQRVNNVIDRRAVGAELRYVEAKRNLYATSDYDLDFKIINMLTANAMASLTEDLQWNGSADFRRFPFLQLSNAVISDPNASFDSMTSVYTTEELRRRALLVTARSYNVSTGFNYKLNNNWYFNSDIRVNYLSSAQIVDAYPSVTGTGYVYSGGGQLVANNVLNLRDSTAIGITRVTSAQFAGWSWMLSERLRTYKNWMMEGGVRYYEQSTTTGVNMSRWAPTAKINYRWQDSVEFELEGGIEYSVVTGPVESNNTERIFGSAGYIWSF